MPNSFLALAAPVGGNGLGAATDTSGLALLKTVAVAGTFVGSVTVEVSEDGVKFAPLATFTTPGTITKSVSAVKMRLNVAGYIAGTILGAVGASILEGNYTPLTVPTTNSSGVAADVSSLDSAKTIIVDGIFSGGLTVEFSVDGTNFLPAASFSNPGPAIVNLYASKMRVTRLGIDPQSPFPAPSVTIGAVSTSAGGGAVGTFNTIDVYLSATTGSPSNLGTKASPLSSPDDVLAKFPPFLFANVTNQPQIDIHYANSLNQWDDDRVVGLPVYSATALQSIYVVSQLWIWTTQQFNYMYTHRGPQFVRAAGLASGPTIIPVGNVKVLSTPAGTKKTRMTFGTNPGWTVGDLKHRMARFINTLTGNQVIFEIPISGNAANSIDMDTDLIQTQLTADLANMTVEICDPGAQITGTVANGGFFDIKAETCAVPFEGGVERCFLNGMGATSGASFDRCTFGFGSSGEGDGWTFFNCVAAGDSTGTQSAQGLVLMNGQTSTNVLFPRPDTVTSPEDQNAGIELLVYQQLQIGRNQPAFTFNFPEGPFSYTAFRNVSCYDAIDSGLEVGIKSMFRTNPTYPQPLNANKVALQGSNNANDGVKCFADGLVVFDSPNTNAGLINITGTLGDLFVSPELAGTPNGIRYGTGAGQFEQAAGWNGNYTHILSATTPTTVILGSTARICTRAFAD